MESESFEDEEVAEILNKNFVSIKVDREERPDIDSIYMTACQALTGHGGGRWQSLWLRQKPFFAGTYFPKRPYGNARTYIHPQERTQHLGKWKRFTCQYSSKVVSVISESIDDDYYYSVDEITEDIFEDAFRSSNMTLTTFTEDLGTHPSSLCPQPVFSSEILAQGQRGVCPCHGRKNSWLHVQRRNIMTT